MPTRILLLLGLFLWSPGQIAAQTEAEKQTPNVEDMMRVFNLKFVIQAPDSTFTDAGEGVWEEVSTKAKIACMALPVSAAEILADAPTQKSEDGSPVTVEPMEINGIKGHLIRSSETSPEGEKWVLLIFISPLEEKFTRQAMAVYPQSQHERLYPKMIQAFGTVKTL